MSPDFEARIRSGKTGGVLLAKANSGLLQWHRQGNYGSRKTNLNLICNAFRLPKSSEQPPQPPVNTLEARINPPCAARDKGMPLKGPTFCLTAIQLTLGKSKGHVLSVKPPPPFQGPSAKPPRKAKGLIACGFTNSTSHQGWMKPWLQVFPAIFGLVQKSARPLFH